MWTDRSLRSLPSTPSILDCDYISCFPGNWESIFVLLLFMLTWIMVLDFRWLVFFCFRRTLQMSPPFWLCSDLTILSNRKWTLSSNLFAICLKAFHNFHDHKLDFFQFPNEYENGKFFTTQSICIYVNGKLFLIEDISHFIKLSWHDLWVVKNTRDEWKSIIN